MRAPNSFFKVVGPLHEQYGDHFRFTVAVIREDTVVLFTRVRRTKRAAASRYRNGEIRQGGVRLSSWKEFRALVDELVARMGLDPAPLQNADITQIKGNLYLRRAGQS